MSDLLRNSLQYADAEQQALAQQRELEEAQNAWAPIKGFRATRIGMDVNANNMDLAAARAGGRTDQAAQLAAENAQLQQRQGMHAPGIERVEDIGTKNGYLRDGLGWFGTQVGSGVASMAEPMAMAAGGALLSRVPGLRTAAPVAAGLGSLAFNQRQVGGSHYGRIAEDEQAMANLGDQGAYQQANVVGALGGAAATAAPWIAGRALGGAALGRAGSAMPGGNFLGKTAFTAGTEGLSEVVEGEVGRTAHTMANPYRDKSGDNSERLNEGLGGIAGGTLPGAAGAAVDTMALGANRTGEAVKDAAGSVRDLAEQQGARAAETAKAAADKANIKQVFDLGMEKGKSVWESVTDAGAKVKDFVTGEDGRADYVGAFNKAQAEYERFKMDQGERDLLTAVLPEDITDPAAKQAWVDDITQRKDDYLYRKMSELEAQGMEEAGSFLDGLESGDPVVRQTAIGQASEFLLERNSAAELQRQIAANQRLMGEGIAKVAGLATRAARKTGEGAMFAGRAAMKGVADELTNKKNKQGTSASLSEPLTYSAWRQIQGDPVVEEMGHAIKRATEGRRVADATDLDLNILRRRQASQSRAQLFGEIMAAEAEAEASRQEARRGLASRVQTERSVTNPDGSRNIDGLANYARTLAYEISDMAESWAGHERTRDTVRAGTALNVMDAMAKDVRLTLRQSAAPVIQRLSEQADPTTKPFFDALLERVQRPVSPQAERAARQSVTDQMVALLPQEFQQELLRDGGTEMLFETVGAISRGRVTAGKRREIEEALGADTVNNLVMAYNGEFATDAGGNPLGETYVDDGLQVMGEGELNDAGEANYVSDDGEYDADGAMGGEISAWERSMKEKTAEMGSGPKIYGLNNDPKARTSPFEPSDKPSKEAVDQYRREERQRHIGMQQPMVRMPQKRPNLFQDEGYDEQGKPIEHRGFKARVAQMEKTLGPDYSIDKRTALEVMDDRKIPTEDRLALYRDYMQAEMLKKDESGNLSEEDRANYEQMIDFISSGMEKARRNPEMWASALRNPRVAMTEEQKRGSGLVKERGNDPDAKVRETLIADMEDYFRSRYMAVAERRIDRDPTSPEAMEVRELTDKARKAVSSIRKNGEDITKANIIWFDTDKRDKNGNVTRVPVRADDLVSWYRKAKAKGEEYSAPDDYSNRVRDESFLKDLSGALAAFVNVPQIKESTVGGPYMEAVGTDGKIRRHQFNEGVPPTLQLETSSYSGYQFGRKNNRRLTPGLGTDAAEAKRMAEVERESRKQNTPAFGDGGWKDAPMQEADASNEGTLNPFGDIMAKFTAEQSKTEYTKATERAEDRAIVEAKADEARKQEAAEARKIADDYKALRESLIAERLGNAEQSPATGHLQARAQAQNDARRALPSTEVSPERRAAIEEGVKSSAVAAAAAATANKKRGTPLTGAALRKQRKHAIAEKVRPLIDERRGGPVTSADPDVLTLKATRIPKNKQDDQVNRKLHREVIASTIGMEDGPERRAAERFADSLITDMDRDSEQTIAEKIDLEVRSGGGHKVTAGLGRITKLNAERLSEDHAALMMTKFWHNGDPNDAAGREASFNRGLQGVTNRLRVALAPEYNPDTGVVGGIHYVWPLTHLLTAKMMGDRSKLTPAQSKTLVTARSAVTHAIASHPKLDVAVKMRMLKNMYPEDQRARITTANFMTILNTEAKTYRALLIERAAKANAAKANAAKTTAAPEVAAPEAPKPQSNPGGVGFKLTPRGPFTPKDQLKADRATAFIGRGSADSATNSYANDARAAGIPVNAGKYSASDVVFVSAEGVRTGRLDPDFKEIDRAMSAGATIITDPSDSVAMKRRHNVGERAVKAHLEKSGYVERKPGEWGPGGAGRKFNKQGAGKPESEQIVDGVVGRMREYYPDMTDGELRQMAIDNLDAMGETSELGRQYQAALAAEAEAEAGQQDGMTDETSPETPTDGPEGLPEPPQDTGEGQGTPKAPRKPRKKGAGGRKKPGHELVAQDDPPAPSPEQTTAIALRVAEPRATDEDIQKARDYVKRVLGDQVRADFEEITGYSGEWIEAEDVIKISTLTNAGILNVTRHEALHAFFSKFIANNPKAVAVFRSLTDDPRIISRLEYLLRDEPAALEQLADGEERLAYIYQFAMAGQLKLPYSPGKTLMEKVRKFLRRVFMMVRNDERAIDLLYAFERGEFNTPSAGTRALARHLDQGTWMTKGARAIDGFSQWTAAAVLPAATILQNSASPTARKLARVLVTNPGEDGSAAKGHGYLNDRNIRMRQYNNLFRGAIDGLDAGQMTELVEVMQRETPDDAVTDPDVLKARQHLRVLFDRFHKYMTKERGVRLGRIKENYFPVVWDANKLREDPEGFKGMLLGKYRGEIEKIVASLEEARQKWISRAKTPEDRVLRETTLPVSAETYVQSIYDSIIGNEGVDDAMARSPKRQDGVLRPWMSAAEKRLLDFIKPEDRAPFMEKDLIHIVTRYVRQGVRTAEYTSRFGRTGARLARALQAVEKELNEAGDKMVAAGDLKAKDREKWVKRQYRDVANAVGAMEGSLGNDVSDSVRKINSWAIVYQNVRVLPLALFSSFVDPLGIVVRGGEMRDAWSAFTRGIKSVVGQWGDMLRDEAKPKQKDHWEKLAELAGVIDSATFSHLLADEYASVYLDGRAKKINEFMFKANGMEAWNRSMRISATKTAVKFMEAHNKGESVHSKRWMRDLGFEPGQLPLDVDGNLITNKRVMMSQFPDISEDTAEAMVEKVHKAINRWVEGAILSPNASQRPAWGSDPRFSMFWHLKQFAYSFHETILKRAVGEAKQGNVMPLGVLAWYIPTMIVADVVKGMAINGGSLPDYMKSYDMSDWMMHGIDRSGVLGAGNVALDGVQDPWGIAGPAVEQIADSFTNPLQQNIINALPANALYKGALI